VRERKSERAEIEKGIRGGEKDKGRGGVRSGK
jgi:hypothetical protein